MMQKLIEALVASGLDKTVSGEDAQVNVGLWKSGDLLVLVLQDKELHQEMLYQLVHLV